MTQKWKYNSEPIVLLNQSIDGSISFLVSDIVQFTETHRNAKQTLDSLNLDLLGWEQLKSDPKSKREKVELLLKIIGNPIDDYLTHL